MPTAFPRAIDSSIPLSQSHSIAFQLLPTNTVIHIVKDWPHHVRAPWILFKQTWLGKDFLGFTNSASLSLASLPQPTYNQRSTYRIYPASTPYFSNLSWKNYTSPSSSSKICEYKHSLPSYSLNPPSLNFIVFYFQLNASRLETSPVYRHRLYKTQHNLHIFNILYFF